MAGNFLPIRAGGKIILLENISRLYGIHEFFLLDYIADMVTLLPGLDRVRHNHYH